MGRFWIESMESIESIESMEGIESIEGFEQIVGCDDERRLGEIDRAERERIFWERVASGKPTAEIRDDSGPSRAWESVEMAIVTLLTVVIFGLGWVAVELDLASLEPIGMPSPPTATSPVSPIWPKTAGSQRSESTESARKGPR